ncbi:MAG: DUF2784 domain-containing protein [Betaproteobacteria bacterium]|nr:DUF2784 domain-containing protein [Betaproteobacteria bacterium]
MARLRIRPDRQRGRSRQRRQPVSSSDYRRECWHRRLLHLASFNTQCRGLRNTSWEGIASSASVLPMNLADVVMLFHLVIVAFNASLLVLIPWGRSRWRWVRNRRIRQVHLLMMLFIAAQTILGQYCPLTLLEANLRGEEAGPLFLARIVHAVLYWDLPLAFFGAIYLLCAAWVVALWRWVPPSTEDVCL